MGEDGARGKDGLGGTGVGFWRGGKIGHGGAGVGFWGGGKIRFTGADVRGRVMRGCKLDICSLMCWPVRCPRTR